MNLPNKLTLSRLGIALAMFVLLEIILLNELRGNDAYTASLAGGALVLFLLAAVTDSLDGYLARRRRIATAFGRVADPLMDKIIICGVLIFLLQIPSTRELVPAWMVVVILVREFLITGLRGFLESKEHDFAASFLGKAKMSTQCVAVSFALARIGFLYDQAWSSYVLSVLMWLTLISTAASGMVYIARASAILRDAKDI